jgi:hypothetical protein
MAAFKSFSQISILFIIYISFYGHAHSTLLSPTEVESNKKFLSQFTPTTLTKAEDIRKKSLDMVFRAPNRSSVRFKDGSLIEIKDKKVLYKKSSGVTQTIYEKTTIAGRNYGDPTRVLLSPKEDRVLIGTSGPSIQTDWYVVSLSDNPKILTTQALRAPHSSISWGADGQTVYYLEMISQERSQGLFENGKKFQARIKRYTLSTEGEEKNDVIFSHLPTTDNMKVMTLSDPTHGQSQNLLATDREKYLLIYNESGLGFGFGAKTMESLFVGVKNSQGGYSWSVVSGRNLFVSQVLSASFNSTQQTLEVVMQTNRTSDRFDIAKITLPAPVPQKGDKKTLTQILKPLKTEVVFKTPSHQKIYHSKILSLNLMSLAVYGHGSSEKTAVSAQVVLINPLTKKVLLQKNMTELGYKTNHGQLFAPNENSDGDFVFDYASVLDGGVFGNVISYNAALEVFTVKRLDAERLLSFGENLEVKSLVYQTRFQGQTFPSLVFYLEDAQTRKPVAPKFIFSRVYAKLGLDIVDQIEPAQVYGILLAKGIFVLPGVPGTTELGAQWFVKGVNNPVEQTLAAAAESLNTLRQDYPLFKSFQLPASQTYVMGRSWGGTQVLAYAAHFPDSVRAVFSVVPVLDIQYNHTQNLVGVLTVGDHAPKLINKWGDQLFGDLLWKSLAKTDPKKLFPLFQQNQAPKVIKLDATGDFVINHRAYQGVFDRKMLEALGPSAYHAFYTENAGHGDRSYEKLILSEVIQNQTP